MSAPFADEVVTLRAENALLRATQGLDREGTLSREVLLRRIAQGLLLDDDAAVQSVKKFGLEESIVRLDLVIHGEPRPLEIPVKKLLAVTAVRGYIAEVCNMALPYTQKQWTPIVNYILSAAEQCPGYSRDGETREWIAGFVQRVCSGHRGTEYAKPTADGAIIYDRILAMRCRTKGILEAAHVGELFFVRRPDNGIIFGQADFIGFVVMHCGCRLGRGELDQRLASIGFQKTPLSVRNGSKVTKLKAVWHSQPGWLSDQDCDLPDEPRVRRINGAHCGP
jgi:hypothetical protein